MRFDGSGGESWHKHRIKLTDFGGMITDWHQMQRMVIVFEDSACKPKEGTLWIDEIRFVKK